jgi:hypothetical protein
MDPIRRNIPAASATAVAIAAAPRGLAQQGTAAGEFYQRGPVRIHYVDFGSGYPLLIIPGGGLNSTIAGLPATAQGSR